jgi:thiamine-monophosphate kinase
LRKGLEPGDELWVSGSLGDGAWALEHQPLAKKLLWPEPRLALGQALREQQLAHAAIDVSDGLASELGHLLQQSSAHRQGLALVAHVQFESLRQCLGPELQGAVSQGRLSLEQACLCAARSGDEYELLFSAPVSARPSLRVLAEQLDLRLTSIGRVEQSQITQMDQMAQITQTLLNEPQVHWYGLDGKELLLSQEVLAGFNHFQEPQREKA